MSGAVNELEARDFCWRCHRVETLCLCSKVRPFRWDPLLVVLIHPKEFKKTIGTARLVKLSIEESRSWIGYGPDFDEHRELLSLLADPSFFPVVLFPGQKSVNLSQTPREALKSFVPPGRRLAIFAVDGSWSLAKKMIENSRVLRELPRISFDVKTPSGYQFRRQPREYCLSTVEAVHLLIENLHQSGICERPANGAHHAMLETFRWLVGDQAARTGM
jgi:DTW domain-containing protein YfiP